MKYAVLLLASGISAAAPASGQIVRGVVADSVSGDPISRATVILSRDTIALDRTLTDENGMFLLRAQDAGQYWLEVREDSYEPSIFPRFSLVPNQVRAFKLLVPSLAFRGFMFDAALVRDRTCGSEGAERGVVFGAVRLAESRRPSATADVVMSWNQLPNALVRLVAQDSAATSVAVVPTDSVGLFVACDIPMSVAIRMHARSSRLSSDFVELAFVPDGVVKNDTLFTISDRIWFQEFLLKPESSHGSELVGTVGTADGDSVLANALVQIENSSFRTRTQTDGSFHLRQLPAGRTRLLVRSPGYFPKEVRVELTQGAVTTIPQSQTQLERLPTELEPIVVSADAVTRRRPLTEFEERRNRGGGSFLTREEFEKLGNPQVVTELLRRVPGIRIVPGERGPVVVTSRARSRTITVGDEGALCPPLYFIDGLYRGKAVSGNDINDMLPVDQIEAIEVYTSAATMPPEFNRTGAVCGVIVFWTR
jgi:hypothetical protein